MIKEMIRVTDDDVISYALIGPDNWKDFELMFLKHGGVSGGCWYTFHLLPFGEFNKMEKLDRKAYHKHAIVTQSLQSL